MSDTGGKIITTILLFVVLNVLSAIFLMMRLTDCGSGCNKKRRDISMVILNLILTFIIPYYIIVIIWGFTKMNYVFGVYMFYIVLTELQEHNFIRKPLFQ
jgi:hypothetical protein|tara:strand:+ start:805 stop:1104 length:300 start_codon:yes stop_codon:yes gene_type:complete